MPLLFLGLILLIKPSYEIALLLLLQGAMPSAVSPSMIMRHYDKKDNIVSLGIFWTHVICLLTVPLFLMVYISHTYHPDTVVLDMRLYCYSSPAP